MDLFTPFDRDDSPGEASVSFDVMERRGSFWYYSGTADTVEEAGAMAERYRADPGTTGVVIDRVTRLTLWKWEKETDAGEDGSTGARGWRRYQRSAR